MAQIKIKIKKTPKHHTQDKGKVLSFAARQSLHSEGFITGPTPEGSLGEPSTKEEGTILTRFDIQVHKARVVDVF